jgi:hypothetical protein
MNTAMTFNQFLQMNESSFYSNIRNIKFMDLHFQLIDNINRKFNKMYNKEMSISELEQQSMLNSGDIMNFIDIAIKKNNVIQNKFKPTKKDASKLRRACYYNALDYIIKNESDYKNIELAWGVVAEETDIDSWCENLYVEQKTINLNYIIHAFLVVDDNYILDPTLPKNKDSYYFYEIVPKKEWIKFRHKFEDIEFDARDFANEYIDKKRMPKFEFDFNKEYMKWKR